MPTSVFFQNYGNSNEQQLAEDLAIEFIKIHGVDFYYLPRTLNNVDPTFHEDASSSYDAAYLLEFYVKSYNGFEGGDFLNKFSSGPALITDNFVLVTSRRSFDEEVTQQNAQVRPFEGDLVFFPFNKKVYKITFVEHESVFYQAGALQVWEIRCALFDYSGELFNTGIPEVDGMTKKYNTNLIGQGLLNPDGSNILDEDTGLPLLQEPFNDSLDSLLGAENDYYQVEGKKIIDFSEIDPFVSGDGTY